ncbi:phage protein Gp19 [Neoasaia chiangmaiensis NBRC 101099]|uniref:Uncharacterized protein n=1 Tax=Neoasaia chiangmaiensis TaxID=320497 RepID=A0A1U9KR91_9PROT|nr:head decoration protein [Neoasaia chiangmaiensis]AQS88265.1 hypothetical protein A0U93_10295 [Neoasaia chiangmaiensis]GBR39697.1 phage protein Gp19 [Neoasaia chiangmaiensis NBRC 101099]GEN14701.1 hypothetical protein NCH01_11320 [Neoasaia chiangmaiensis]
MVSPVLNEHFYTGAFLVREANGFLSRDEGVLVNETSAPISFEGGLILSSATSVTGEFTFNEGNTGNGTIGAISVATGTAPANYSIEFTDATDFTVTAPDGSVIGTGTAGTAFSGGGLGFTVTAGSTPFVAGDGFTIVVVATSEPQYVPYTGAANAVGVLFNRRIVEAESASKVTVISRMAEVNGAELEWDASVEAAANAATLQAQALAQLKAQGIVAR